MLSGIGDIQISADAFLAIFGPPPLWQGYDTLAKPPPPDSQPDLEKFFEPQKITPYPLSKKIFEA